MAHAQHHKSQDRHFTVGRLLAGAALGGAAITAVIVAAPHILPELGIGSAEVFDDAMWASHNYMAGDLYDLSIKDAGSGIAGALNRAMTHIPLIGEKLAEGGLFNAGVSAVTGLGGYLLGGFIADREDGSKKIRWGNVIKYAALSASALIALPTLLSGITMGITYLAMLTENPTFVDQTIESVNHSVGVSGGRMTAGFLGFSGAAATIPHLFTCGLPLLPAALTWHDAAKHNHTKHEGETQDVKGSISLTQPAQAGKQAIGTIRLQHADGKPLTENELKTVHTKKLHLMITDNSLTDYHHIHPQPSAIPGTYLFSFTPAKQNQYSAWADITLQNGQHHKLKMPVPSKSTRSIPAPVARGNTKEIDGLHVEWRSQPLKKGQTAMVDVTVKDDAGNVVNDLQAVMGAYAHMVGFSADGKSLVHCHPSGPEPTSPHDRGSGHLRFHVQPESSGKTQFFIQIRKDNQDIHIPFGQTVQAEHSLANWIKPASGPQHSHALGV